MIKEGQKALSAFHKKKAQRINGLGRAHSKCTHT